MALRYCKDQFTNEYKKTLGTDMLQRKKFIKSIDKEVTFHVWDTAGQEYYDSLTKKYYRGAHVAIFVFSVIDRDSFLNIAKWKSKVLEVCDSKIPMILVMNKMDMEVDLHKVTDNEAINLASQLGMYLFRCSVKNNVKIEEIFNTAAFEYMNKNNKKTLNLDSVEHISKNKDENVNEITKKEDRTVVDKQSMVVNGFKIENKKEEVKQVKKKSDCC